MSAEAKIFPADEATPSRAEVARRFGAIKQVLGTIDLNQEGGATAIEIIFGRDDVGRLVQMPVTYREEEIDADGTLTTITHEEQGTRYVTAALSDPVAVTEIIRTIIQGGQPTLHADGNERDYFVTGSGDKPDAEITDTEISEATRQRARGTIKIDGQVYSYLLRMTNLPHPQRPPSTDYSTPALRLTAGLSGEAGVVIAELVLSDGL